MNRGGKSLTALDRDGAFLRPGLIDVTGVDVPDEELFAPFVQIIRVPDLDAAIATANATRFGLASRSRKASEGYSLLTKIKG